MSVTKQFQSHRYSQFHPAQCAMSTLGSNGTGRARAVIAEGLGAVSPPLAHAPPTQNEALGEAPLALAGKPLHSHS